MPEPNFLDTDRSQLLQSNLRWNLSRWAVTHQAFVGFLMIACSIAGLVTYWQMGRAEDPSFTIKTALVGAVWPGATADEMQRYVAKKIEDKLRETPKLDSKTLSGDGMSLTLGIRFAKSSTISGGNCQPASLDRRSTTSTATFTAESTCSLETIIR